MARVHTRSMSPVSCDVRSNVTRSRLDSVHSSSRIMAFADTSRPMVGSSRNSMRGDWIRLAPAAHPLAERQVPHGRRDERAERKHGRQRLNPPPVFTRVDLVDAAEQLERVARRQLIPELRALSEDGADLKRELTPLPRRHES